MKYSVGILLVILLLSVFGSARPKKTRFMTGSASKDAVSAHLHVVPDLPQRVARFRRVQMPFRTAGLSAREVQLVHKLVEASGYLESIYWRQSDPEALAL